VGHRPPFLLELSLTTEPRRFYLASRKDRSRECDVLQATLEAAGWKRTYAWTDAQLDAEHYAAVASAELAGVREANVLVVLLPGGYGTHVEIGAALALGKPIIIHAPDRETLKTPYPCIFHYHPSVELLISEVIDPAAVLACMQRRVTA
jgi:nucleoside 2-deoxyribosyltransferase